MKNLILILFMSVGMVSNAQFVVSDPGNTAVNQGSLLTAKSNLIKNSSILAKAITTLKTLNDTRSKLKSWNEELNEIRNTIAAGKEIISILETVEDVTGLYRTSIDFVVNEPLLDLEQKEFIISIYTNVLVETVESFDTGDLISSKGNYKMNDADRLNILRDVQGKLQDNLDFLNYVNAKFAHMMRQHREESVTAILLGSQGRKFID